MTKADLIMALYEFDGDAEVTFQMVGTNTLFSIESVEEYHGNPVLVQDEAPEFEDICKMADACYDEYKKTLPKCKLQALAQVSDMAQKHCKERGWKW